MISKLSLLIGLGLAAEWDYKFNGKDWTKLGSCGGRRQSPIDLRSTWTQKLEIQPW